MTRWPRPSIAAYSTIPGLVEYRIGRGIKGDRTGEFAAVGVYESREAWTELWGSVDNPVATVEYPDAWRTWEDELLDPLLATDPDEIEYTTYDLLAGSRADAP